MRVPQTAPIFDDPETEAAVLAVLRTNWLTEGEQCEAFTAELLEYIGAPYGCLVCNGTMALELALRAVGAEPGKRILVPDLTFAATANAVVATGAIPVLTDAWSAWKQPLYGGVPVWLFGNRASWLSSEPVPHTNTVEDAAQALGCWHDGKHAGTFGDAGCFSFYADKILSTGGEGGFIVCRERETWERLEQLRNHGRSKGARGYAHEAFGVNARMTEVHAAIGRVQLRHLEEWRAKRLDHWHHYAAELDGLGDVTMLPVDQGSVPFRAVIYVPDPAALAAHLEEREIQTRRMFLPLHRQPFLSRYVQPGQTFPCADYAYDHGLLLSVHQNLSEDQVSWVCESVRAFYH